MTKAAISHLTKCLAVEWGKHGITVNAVAPTFIATPGTEPALSDPAFRADVEERIAALHRIGTPDDVTGAVVFLASPAASLDHGPDDPRRRRLDGAMRPFTLPPNVLRHFYAGGERIAALRGTEPADHTPEEWIGAANTTFDGSRGLSRLADGTLVRDALEADPEAFLGPEHTRALRRRSGAARQAARRRPAAARSTSTPAASSRRASSASPTARPRRG